VQTAPFDSPLDKILLHAFECLNQPAPELQKSTMDRYVKQEKGGGDIGKGAYGVVYKGTDKQTGKTVAMKVRSRWINSPHINSPK
jgi:hypothetical protein